MFKKKNNIRIMSFFLAFIMILSLLPLNVFAAKPAPKPGAGINAGAGTGDGGTSDMAVGGWGGDPDGGETRKKKSNVRKYLCPSCGCSVRATKEVHIGCLDCDCPMELVEK